MNSYHSSTKTSDYVGKEVFLVATNQNGYTFNKIEFFEKIEDALRYMRHDLSIDLDNDVKILHGVLTPAKVLPNKLNGANGYLIAADDIGRDICLRNESYASVDDLQSELTQLLKDEDGESIEGVYILYGYELQPFMAVDIDEIDDGEMEQCRNISYDVMNIIKRQIK